MLEVKNVTKNTVSMSCGPYDEPITCNPDSGWCNPDICTPQDAPSSNCGPDFGDCNPD